MTTAEAKAAERSLMTAKERKAADKVAYKEAVKAGNKPAAKAGPSPPSKIAPFIKAAWVRIPFLAGFKGGYGERGFAVVVGNQYEFCGTTSLRNRYGLSQADAPALLVEQTDVEKELHGLTAYGKSAFCSARSGNGSGAFGGIAPMSTD